MSLSNFAVIEGMSIESVNRASEKIQVIVDEVSYWPMQILMVYVDDHAVL